MKEDVQVHFDKINGSWMWFVEKGKYQMRGACDTLDKAESKAFEVLGNLPDVGVVHTFYSPGKPVDKPAGTFEQALNNEGFKATTDKTESDYWDKWDNDWGSKND